MDSLAEPGRGPGRPGLRHGVDALRVRLRPADGPARGRPGHRRHRAGHGDHADLAPSSRGPGPAGPHRRRRPARAAHPRHRGQPRGHDEPRPGHPVRAAGPAHPGVPVRARPAAGPRAGPLPRRGVQRRHAAADPPRRPRGAGAAGGAGPGHAEAWPARPRPARSRRGPGRGPSPTTSCPPSPRPRRRPAGRRPGSSSGCRSGSPPTRTGCGPGSPARRISTSPCRRIRPPGDREGVAALADLAILGDEAHLDAALARLADGGATDFAAQLLPLDESTAARTTEFLASRAAARVAG